MSAVDEPTEGRERAEEADDSNREFEQRAAERAHHYGFAHHVLRNLIFQRPLELFALAATGGRGLVLLKTFWRKVGEDLLAHGGKALPDQGLSAKIVKVDGRLILLVRLPPPQGPPEAYFVAAVVTVPPRKRWFRRPTPPSIRYFTLERSVDLSGMLPGHDVQTVLGEWDKGGMHYNCGDGPAAEEGAFLAAVTNLLNGAPPWLMQSRFGRGTPAPAPSPPGRPEDSREESDIGGNMG